MNQEMEQTKARKQNMKIYSLYRAISLDLIFYYAISFLFLTQVKKLSASEVVLGDAFYAVFMMIFQIPASMLVDKIGTRKCTILANGFNSLFVILIMCCKNLKMLIFAQFISSLCFSLKDISDTALIQYSIPQTKKQGEIYAKIEGKGTKDYYFINAITYIVSGFLYVINPYIPMIGSLAFTMLAIFMSLGFEDIKQDKKEKQTAEQYMDNLWEGIKFISKSQRLRSLFLYSGIAWGVLCLTTTYRTSLLVDIQTPEQIIAIIAAIMSLAASIGSKKQIAFHNYFRNKSLSAILFIITGAVLVIGMVGILNLSYAVTLSVIIIGFILINFVAGINNVLPIRYLSNFASGKILTQIYAINAISKNLFRAIIGFLGSYLLGITNTSNAILLIGIILLITVLGLVSYMKTRLGLKPTEYDEKEIFQE